MPDDPLFASPAPVAIDPTPPVISDDPAPSPDNGASDTIQAEAIQQAVAAAVAPLQQGMQSRIDDLEAQNMELQRSLANPPQPAPQPQADPSVEDFYNQFSTDPHGTIEALVAKQVQDGLKTGLRDLSPLLQQHNTAAHSAYMVGHQQQIDQEFGSGTFQNEFAPILSKRFEQVRNMDPTRLSDPEWLAQEVMGVKGFKMNDLFTRKQTHESKTQEQRESEVRQMAEHLINQTNLSGGLTPPVSSSREPSAAEQEYIENLSRHGIRRDPSELRSAVTTGNTLSDYRQKQKEQEKKK